MKRRRSAPTLSRPRIAAVIFDLDDTLYDCLRQRVRAAHRYAARAMVQAGVPATVDAVFRARLRACARDPQPEAIDREVCRHFDVKNPREVARIARRAFYSLPVGRLRLFPGVRALLRRLHRSGVRIFVVSFGDPPTQRAKIAALGLGDNPAIERVLYADAAGRITKEDAFRRILKITRLDPATILVVGDRPNSEILAGNRLGMRTARVRGGEFARLAPAGREERAQYSLRRATDLFRLPLDFAGQESTQQPARSRQRGSLLTFAI